MKILWDIFKLFGILLTAGFTDNTESTATLGSTVVTTGLHSPWGLAVLPDGSFLVTEKVGRIHHISKSGLKMYSIQVPGVVTMLDVAVNANYLENSTVYFSSVRRDKLGFSVELTTAVLSQGKLENIESLFVVKPKLNSTGQYGGRILFLNDGTLLLTIGDQQQAKRAQVLYNHQGKILRIEHNNAYTKGKSSAVYGKEIYSYGHRNVQGLSQDKETGLIWAVEHGPIGNDELNLIGKGNNYGWPLQNGAKTNDFYSGFTEPSFVWDEAIAPSSLFVHSGKLFPRLKGRLIIGSLVGKRVIAIEVKDGNYVGDEILFVSNHRIRDVAEGNDGNIYAITDSYDGELLLLTQRQSFH